MSDEMEDVFDEDELEEMFGDAEDSMNPEDFFKMVLINRIRNVKTTVELQYEDGDTVPINDSVKEILSYIQDQMSEGESNNFNSQIMPLMTQAAVSSLARFIGPRKTAFYLAQPESRQAFIVTMCVGFLLLKFVQQNGLKIHTFEEEVTDEEIEDIDRKSRANSTATLAALAGHDPRAVLRELRDKGYITEEDVYEILGENGEDDEEGSTNN